jgi:hypothetical protein
MHELTFPLMDSSRIKALIMLIRLQNTTSMLTFAIKNQEIKLPDPTQHNARSRIVTIIGLNTTTQISSQIISSIKKWNKGKGHVLSFGIYSILHKEK